MRTTVKELKKWLENVSDDAIISINTYANNHENHLLSLQNGMKTENQKKMNLSFL